MINTYSQLRGLSTDVEEVLTATRAYPMTQLHPGCSAADPLIPLRDRRSGRDA